MKFYHPLREWDPIVTWLADHFGPADGKWEMGSEFDVGCVSLKYFITIHDRDNALLFALAWPCEIAEA